MIKKSTFAKNLSFLRKAKNFKQKCLSETISVSVKTVQRWEDESSESWPTTPEIFKLSNLFGVTIEKLCCQNLTLGRDGNMQQKIDKIQMKIENDQLFFAFCHLAYSKHPKELEAWMSLLEVQYLFSDNS